jgi:AcrR family transcriptional regulator
MITEMGKRKYTLKRRAERREATRDRIVEATVALHETVGPRDTTITAIAERAGVQRLTVYRHFPDETSLVAACSTRWLEQNPPPDPRAWADPADPAERTRVALEAVYAYYRRTASMWTSVQRDRGEVPAMDEPMARFDAYLDGIRSDLRRAWEPPSGPAGAGACGSILGHALRFSTWQSLDGEGLDDSGMADLIARWLRSVR